MVREKKYARPDDCERKFFYLLTCEYCFSHYVAAALIALSNSIAVAGWRGYLWPGLVWCGSRMCT